MSGGRWDYGRNFEDNEEAILRINASNLLLKALEHELDWGLSGDTCRDCARLRAVAALEQFFDDRASNAEAATAIARDSKQNRCPKCIAYYKTCKHPQVDPRTGFCYSCGKHFSTKGAT